MSKYDWVNRYIGLPWENNGRGVKGYDCWGLIERVFKEQGKIELPSWNVEGEYTLPKSARALTRGLKNCIDDKQVEMQDAPQDFDICMLTKKRTAFHVGIYINGGVLHISQNARYSTWERLEDFEGYGGNLRFYRWLA